MTRFCTECGSSIKEDEQLVLDYREFYRQSLTDKDFGLLSPYLSSDSAA